MATYRNTSFGKHQLYLVDEHLDHVPVTRVFFAIITSLIGIFIVCRLSQHFHRLWTQRKRSKIMTLLFLDYIFNTIFHTIHYSGEPLFKANLVIPM